MKRLRALLHVHSDPNWQTRGVVRYWQCKCGARRTSWSSLNLRGPVEPGWPRIIDEHGESVLMSRWVMPE